MIVKAVLKDRVVQGCRDKDEYEEGRDPGMQVTNFSPTKLLPKSGVAEYHLPGSRRWHVAWMVCGGWYSLSSSGLLGRSGLAGPLLAILSAGGGSAALFLLLSEWEVGLSPQ
jgi:hypothetical protein